jgi:hypothetical protein
LDFLRFWAFNTAGKTVTKVGIYALPPLGRSQKVEKSQIFNKKQILNKFIVSTVQAIYRDPILTLTIY